MSRPEGPPFEHRMMVFTVFLPFVLFVLLAEALATACEVFCLGLRDVWNGDI